MVNLTYMPRGKKACLLFGITCVIVIVGSFMLLIGPDKSQNTGGTIVTEENVTQDGIFDATSSPIIMDVPTMAQPSPVQPPPPALSNPTVIPIPIVQPTPRPTPLLLPPAVTVMPIRSSSPVFVEPTSPQPTQPSSGAPIVTMTPISIPSEELSRYPFAIVYECDWKGHRITLTTKTESDNVVNLCIEMPPPRRPDTAAAAAAAETQPVEIAYLKWFVFTRQPYDTSSNHAQTPTEPLEPLIQHAVLQGRADPFGLTILNCPAGTTVCRLATSIRSEFFTRDAFLVGKGELILQFTETNTLAGYSPITIYFLLSDSSNMKEPIVLGRSGASSSGSAGLVVDANKINNKSGGGGVPPSEQTKQKAKSEYTDHQVNHIRRHEPLIFNKPPT